MGRRHMSAQGRRAVAVAALVLLPAARSPAGEITQHFPADKPAADLRTQWRVVWGVEEHAGGSEVLVIKEAHFKRGPKEPEIQVLGDCRLADIFVPYHDGTRIFDISGEHFPLVRLTRNDATLGPACIKPGAIFGRDGAAADTGLVAAEVHDGQIRWMNASETIRRGQELAVWSVLNGANYRYVILYQFRDDGQVGFRLGATAHNLNSSDADSTTHLHLGCWRINVELGGAARTQVSVVRHDAEAAKTVETPLAAEARIAWEPEKFTRLRVTSTTEKNGHQPTAHPIGYELIPVRMGSARYGGVGEEFTRHDLWVTVRRTTPDELMAANLNALENQEKIAGVATTLWHHAPVLHVARDEDFGPVGTDQSQGVAITAWAGCDLKPRNFFAGTPLYP